MQFGAVANEQVMAAMAGAADPASLSYRLVPNATVKRGPAMVFNMDDASIILADDGGGPAQQVWLDGARAPQLLAADTRGAMAVLPVDNGYLIVHYNGGWVARTGSVAWKHERIRCAFSAVVVGGTALVSCCGCDGDGAPQVVRLDMQSGRAIGSIGKGTLQEPKGVAVGADGTIFVADSIAHVVQVLGCCCLSRSHFSFLLVLFLIIIIFLF